MVRYNGVDAASNMRSVTPVVFDRRQVVSTLNAMFATEFERFIGGEYADIAPATHLQWTNQHVRRFVSGTGRYTNLRAYYHNLATISRERGASAEFYFTQYPRHVSVLISEVLNGIPMQTGTRLIEDLFLIPSRSGSERNRLLEFIHRSDLAEWVASQFPPQLEGDNPEYTVGDYVRSIV